MKKLLQPLLILASILLTNHAYAANCQSRTSGTWNSPLSWNNCNNTFPQNNDNVTIRNNHTITLNVSSNNLNSLTIDSGGNLLKNWGTTNYNLNVNNDFTNNGTLTYRQNGSINIGRNLINNSTGIIKFESHVGTFTVVGNVTNSNSIEADSGSQTQFTINGSFTNATTSSILRLAQNAFNNSLNIGETFTNSGQLFASFGNSNSLNNSGLATNGGDLNFNTFVNNATGAVNISFGTPNFKISGDFTNSNPNLNVENSFFYFNGYSQQNITGLKKVFSFALDNPSGAILNSKLELGIGSNQNGGLILLNGKLDTSTASNDITISYIQTCTQGNNFFYRNPGSWVTGKFLQKFNYNESGNCTFPVGTTFNYSPIILTSNSWPAPQTGSVVVQAFHGEHPDTLSSSSGINSSANINKYWNLSSPDNPTLFQNSLFSINARICSSASGADCTISDLDTSLNFNNLIARYKDNTWSDVNISSKTATNVTINNLTKLGTLVLGEFKEPPTLTCFNTNYNTDISQWIVAGTYTPNIVTVPNGDKRLRLTDNVQNRTSFAQLKRWFPGAGNKIVVEFNNYAYGGNGADGISLVFSDASITSSPGGYGGSLGYANYTSGISGFTGGWLGIGFDEFGNFANPTENRRGYPSGYTPITGANTPAGFYANSIAIRGSGSGTNGYWLLANTGTLSPRIWTSSNTYLTQSRYRVTMDHSNNINAYITVERDTTGTGSNYVTLINKLDVKKTNSQQAAVPAQMIVSFTSGTGGSTNIHEISNLNVCAFESTPVGGQTSASNYAVLEPSSLATWNASARKPLFTKISGIPFSLDVAALKIDGTIENTFVNSSNPSKTVQLELFNFNPATSCSAYSSPITSQNVTFTTTNSHYYPGRVTSSSFTVNSAHKEVIARITDSSVTPAIQSCSTDTFTIRPSQLLLLNTSATGDSLGSNNSSSVIIPTGNSFSMTVGTNTIGYNGMPSINATKMNWNNLPSGGQIGVLTGNFSTANATNGNDSIGNNFTYSEVGYFNFLAQGIYDENFISSNDVNNGDCTLNYSNTLSSDKYGCYFGNINPTSHIGRFVPSTFKFLSPSITNRVESACTPVSSFTYLTEPLILSTTIQALNQNNQIVKNYSGNFNRFDNFSFNLRANTSSINLTSKINLISQTGNFVNGVNNYVTKFSLNRDSTPTNPYFNTVISSAFSDLDNIKSSPINNDVNLDSVLDSTSLGITNFYFGRLRLSNNKGSDLLPLKVDLFTEYFDNNSFKIMILDNCTTLNSNRFSTSNFVGDLASNEISFTYPSPLKMGNGMVSILMNKPSGGDGNYAGTFEFNYDLLSDNKPYLQSQWVGTSSYSQNPKSQITISKKSGNSKFLFIKELF